jgi:non-ribosomal peptide synthetase component F
MKQKFLVQKSASDAEIIIRENAELDKELMSLLCEERFDVAVLETALANGREGLIAALRTRNLYPPKAYAEKIADAVQELLNNTDEDAIELFFDDLDLLDKERQAAAKAAEMAQETDDIDELIEDEFEGEFEEGQAIGKIKASIKIADDDAVDGDAEI